MNWGVIVIIIFIAIIVYFVSLPFQGRLYKAYYRKKYGHNPKRLPWWIFSDTKYTGTGRTGGEQPGGGGDGGDGGG